MLFGGADFGREFGDTWEYDGSAWKPIAASGPAARSLAAMSYDSKRKLVVLVGGQARGYLADVWEYDGAGWRQGVNPPDSFEPRSRHAMAYDSRRGSVVLFGGDGRYIGCEASAHRAFHDTWEYDGARWVLTALDPLGLEAGRASHAMVYDSARGLLILFGGSDGSERGDIWEYDGASWVGGPGAPR